MLMTDEEKAIKAMKIRENFMTTNRSGAFTLYGRRPESEQRLNVSRPSHGRKLGLLRLWLHGDSPPISLDRNPKMVFRIDEILTECRVSTTADTMQPQLRNFVIEGVACQPPSS